MVSEQRKRLSDMEGQNGGIDACIDPDARDKDMLAILKYRKEMR